MSKNFSLGAVLSITDGRLMTSMDEVYAILKYMTSDDLTTLALVPAAEQCKPALLAQHPRLAEFKCEKMTPENYKQVLKDAEKTFGKEFAVTPLKEWDTEAAAERVSEMLKGKSVIVVTA